MEESTPKRGIPKGLIAGLAAAALAAVLAGGYFGLCAWVQGNQRLLPGAVAVDDRNEIVADLGKLTQEDALALVSGEMDRRLDSRKLTLLYGEGRRAEFTGELMDCSPETVVRLGMSVKQNTPFWKLGALWLGLAQGPHDLPLSAAAFTPEGEDKAKQLIQAVVDEVYTPPVDFTYTVGEEAVEVTPGSDGQELNAAALLEAVEEALAQGAAELVVEPTPVPGAELSGEILNQLVYVEPKPAGPDENGKLVPAVIGLSVNPEEAQAILDQTAPGETCSIPLEYTPPDTPADQ